MFRTKDEGAMSIDGDAKRTYGIGVRRFGCKRNGRRKEQTKRTSEGSRKSCTRKRRDDRYGGSIVWCNGTKKMIKDSLRTYRVDVSR